MVSIKEDAEDLVQESYIKASSNISSFKPERASLKTWVFTIAINSAKNQLDRMKRWGENDLSTCENYHSSSPELMAEIGEVFHSTPDARFEMKEHLDYCFTCITKTRKIAALALTLTFGVSSFLIFLAGKTAFGFFPFYRLHFY